MNIANNVTELIGRTPLVKLNKLSANTGATVLVKLESMNPASSVKDRLGYALITEAEAQGLLMSDTTIIEPTSGNTGIALAMVAAVKGYKFIAVMPESMTIERRNILRAFGAEIVLTPAEKGMKGAIERTEEMVKILPNSFVPQQFKNMANVRMHQRTTAVEIWEDTEGRVDIFVAGVGTGGTLTGVASVFKSRKSNFKTVAVEPSDSAVLKGEIPKPHKIQGLGAGFIPDILNIELIDEIITVENDQAFETARELAKQEGILCGISAGANVFAALQVAQRPENKGKIIVTIICDTGERYLSTPLFQFENV